MFVVLIVVCCFFFVCLFHDMQGIRLSPYRGNLVVGILLPILYVSPKGCSKPEDDLHSTRVAQEVLNIGCGWEAAWG